MSRQADVVVPVFSNVELTARCLESVWEHSGPELGQLIVVNDCSKDAGMAGFLRQWARAHPQRVLLENERNLGFVASANRGLSLRKRDVVLLNNDTEVTSGWLRELLEVADSAPDVGAVVPLSNHASLCSVPRFCEPTPAEGLADIDVSRLHPRSVEMPTGVGFCLLLKDAALKLLGALDPAYGRGYNEENDWCMRAREAGLRVLRAQRALVFHHGSISFGEEKQALDIHNAHLLCHRYPQYLEINREFAQSPHARLAAHAVSAMKSPLTVSFSGNVHPALTKALSSSARVKWVTEPLESGVHVSGVPSSPDEVEALLAQTGHLMLHVPHLGDYLTPSRHEDAAAFQRHRAWTYVCIQAAQKVWTDSEFSKAQLLREFHLPKERVRVLPPVASGVSAAPVEAKPPSIVVAGGRRHRPWAWEAWALLRAKRGGQCPPLVWWKEEAPSPLEGQRAENVVEVAHPSMLKAWLPSALAVVFPDMYSDEAPSVVDALSAGAPAIVRSQTPGSEWVGDGGVVLSTHSARELSETLLSFLENPIVHAQVCKAALQHAKRFDEHALVHTLVREVEEVLQAPDEGSLHHRRMLRAAWGLLRSP